MLCTAFIYRIAFFIYRIAFSVTLVVAAASDSGAPPPASQRTPYDQPVAFGAGPAREQRPAVRLHSLWEDLKRNLESGSCLVGAAQTLDALVKHDDVRTAPERFSKAWQDTDVTLTSAGTVK